MLTYYNTYLINAVLDKKATKEERNLFIKKNKSDIFVIQYEIQKEVEGFFNDFDKVEFINKLINVENRYFSGSNQFMRKISQIFSLNNNIKKIA